MIVSHLLANGGLTLDRRLDCIAEYDARSLAFLTRDLLEPDAKIFDKEHACEPFLDQGLEGACVGFGFSHELAADPSPVADVTDAKARALYKDAQKRDEWPGERYEGTSVLAGAKACGAGKFFDSYFWAKSAREIAQALANLGPVVIGINWHEGMENTDYYGFIRPTGSVRGGHCVCLRGVRLEQKPGEEFSVLGRNSWGKRWGYNGEFRIYGSDLQRLVEEPGSAFCVPVSRHDTGTWPEARRKRWFEFLRGVRG